MIDRDALLRRMEAMVRDMPDPPLMTAGDPGDPDEIPFMEPTRTVRVPRMTEWRWDPHAAMAVLAEPEREEVGPRAVCENCKLRLANFDGLCRNCAMCHMCGAYTMKKEEIAQGKQRCVACCCKLCESYAISMRDDEGQGWCVACYIKANPDKLCGLCQRNQATVIVRSQTKPTVCMGCMREHVPGRFISCYYCNGMAVAVWTKYAVCDFHATQSACGDSGCNPSKMCGNCTLRLAQDRMERATRRNGQRGGVPHNGHDPKVFDMRGCEGCMWREGRGIFLPAPEQPVFWPEWVEPLKTTPPVLPMTQRRRNHSSRYIALEIEVASVLDRSSAWQIAATVEKWGGSVVRDASLGEGGFEVNLSPAAGDHFVEQVEEICRTIERVGGVVDDRCGLHVHVNTRDFAYADMRRLLMLYGKLEPALLRTQPAARTYRGRYAMPCGAKYRAGIPALSQPKGDKKNLVKSIYGMDMVRPLRHRNGHNREIEARYDFFNVHSWFYRGTVECRGHSGTVSARKMLPWGMLWASIVDTAYRMTERTISSIGHDEESSVELMMTLAPSDYVRRYLATRLAQYRDQYEGSGF